MTEQRHWVVRARRYILGIAWLLCSGLAARPAVAQATPQQGGTSAGERSTPVEAVPEKREQERDENDAYRHSKMVVKLGSLVGMNGEQAATAFEVLNFLVLAAGVVYLASKTLPKSFRERSTAIQKNLVEARTATEEASARLGAVEDRLSKLDAEIAAMRQHVEAETAREAERLRGSIAEETAKIVAAAEGEIQAATATARRELQRHAAELALEQATRRLVITPDTDRLLVRGFAEQLGDGFQAGSRNGKGGQN